MHKEFSSGYTPDLPKQKERPKKEFDSGSVLNDEKYLLSKLRGRAKEVARVLLLGSIMVIGEGMVSTANAAEKTPVQVTHIEKEESVLGEPGRFVEVDVNQQNQYLTTIVLEPAKYEIKNEMMGNTEVTSRELVVESGMKRIVELKENLDEMYEKETNPKRKEKINKAFLVVHRFVLEYGINNFGNQALTVYGINDSGPGTMDVGELMLRLLKDKPLYDPNETNDFLEEGKQGERLSAFIKEVKKVSGSELSKIKQIYDLVAFKIPRYKWYNGNGERGEHGYQSFEQLLEKQAGICTEKNALLAYALRQAGIDAYLWGFGGHIYTRVLTSEGALEIDVTNSHPFTLNKLATQGEYSYNTNGDFVKFMPKELQQYAQKWGEGDSYRVSIPLNSPELVGYVATSGGITADSLKNILFKIADVKPHPLYESGKKGVGNITPDNAGKYSADLFKGTINNE